MKTNARKILSLVLSFLMVFGSVATLLPTTVMAATVDATTDGSTIDCVIYSAADIYANGAVSSLVDNANETNSTVTPGRVELKGLVDGMARYGTTTAGGTVAATDRMLIKIDDVVFADYPYCVIAYNTNINATTLNFNMTTKDRVAPDSASDHKIFVPQDRVVGSLSTGVASYNTAWPAETKITGIYIPIFNTSTNATMSDDEYFDVQYIGFFKNSADAEKFDYTAYAQKTITVTNEDGTEVINSFNATIGDMVKLLENVDVPYANKDGAFAVLADAEGNVYSISREVLIIDDLTLKIKYLASDIYLADELLANKRELKT